MREWAQDGGHDEGSVGHFRMLGRCFLGLDDRRRESEPSTGGGSILGRAEGIRPGCFSKSVQEAHSECVADYDFRECASPVDALTYNEDLFDLRFVSLGMGSGGRTSGPFECTRGLTYVKVTLEDSS